MNVPATCPEDDYLKALIDESLPREQEAALAGHLEGCAACRRRLEELAAGSQSWDTTLLIGTAATPQEPALGRLVATLEDATPDTPDNSPSMSSTELSFLAPPRQPGHLGRLDHYEVEEIVGRGGMGLVLKAFDEKLRRVVAIKALAPALAASATARSRFLREAHAAAAVAHEHVIAIHAIEEQTGMVPYLVMQFIPGRSLEDKLRESGPVGVKEILRIGIQIAEGLAAAHKCGLIHRDIKPANVLLENGVERVKITDFGLARAVDDASLTQSGVIAGTPMYMSPEQARGADLDHRSDLFSFGSVLYALCTGRPPFRASNTMAVLKRVCEETPRPIREVNPDIPDWLADIIMTLLAKDPAERFQSAQEVADLLARHLAHLQHPYPISSPIPPTRPLSQRRRAVILSVGVLLLCIVGAAFLLSRDRSAERLATVPKDNDAPEILSTGSPTPPAPEELAKRPSVLDALRPDDLPEEIRKQLPPEVVGVLGGSAFELPEGLYSWMVTDRDGRRLAVPCDDKILLFDARSGRHLRTLTGLEGRVYCCAFSPDGKRLAAGNWQQDAIVTVWDTRTGEKLFSLRGHSKNVNHIAFSADGHRVVTASADETARIWDAEKTTELFVLKGHMGAVATAVFTQDGRVVTGGEDGAKVWDATTGTELQSLDGPGGPVTALACSPDGKLLAGGNETGLRIWDTTGYKTVCTVPVRAAWLDFAPDSKSVLAGGHNWHTDENNESHIVKRLGIDGKELATFTLKGQGGWAAFGLTPDGRTLYEVTIHTADRNLRTYDTGTGQERVLTPTKPPHALAISPNGSTLATGNDHTLRLWDLATTLPRAELAGHQSAIRCLVFSPDSRTLASASVTDLTVRLWDVTSGQERGRLPTESPIRCLAFSPDGRFLAALREDGAVKLWDTEAGRLVRTFTGSGPCRGSICFSPDGRELASCGGEGICRWLVATGELRPVLPAHRGKATGVAFSPDGHALASWGEDRGICIWAAGTGELRQVLEGHGGVVESCVWAPDSRLLASVGADRTVRLWDVTANPPRAKAWVLPGSDRPVCGVAFTPEGRYLIMPGPGPTLAVTRLAKPGEVPQVGR